MFYDLGKGIPIKMRNLWVSSLGQSYKTWNRRPLIRLGQTCLQEPREWLEGVILISTTLMVLSV